MNGILLEVEPVLLRLGPINVRWYSLLLVAALAVGGGVAIRRAMAGTSLRVGGALDLLSWVLLAGLVGARLLHIAEHWEFYASRPGALMDLENGGLSAWGAIIFGGAALALQARQRGLSFAGLLDSAAPALALGDGLAQLGCLLNGDGQGLPSDLPWATQYRSIDAMTPDFGVARHPCQVYQLLADLLILAVLLRLRGTSLARGTRFSIWLGLYGLSRVVVGTARLDPALLLGLQLAQLLGLAAIVIAAGVLLRPTGRPAAGAAFA